MTENNSITLINYKGGSYMKKLRMIASVVCLAMLVSFAGCNKTEGEKTDKTEASTAVSVTEKTEEAEESEKMEPDKTEPTGDVPEPTSAETSGKPDYFTNYAGDESRFSELYDEFRSFATALNSENPDNLYGIVQNSVGGDMNWEYAFLVYDGTNVKAYHEEGEDLAETELSFYGYGDEGMKPESFLLPYDKFMEIPFLVDFSFLSEYGGSLKDTDMDVILPDGGYCGNVFGFSSDMKYLYSRFGQVLKPDLTPEECLNLKVGDKVKLNGEEYEVTRAEIQEDYKPFPGNYVLDLGDTDNGGYFLAVKLDDNGQAECYSVYTCFGYTAYDMGKLARIEIADDADIELYVFNGYTDFEQIHIKGSELKEKCDFWLTVSPDAVVYENGGIGLNSAFYMGMNVDESGQALPVQIKDGKIVYMNFAIAFDVQS